MSAKNDADAPAPALAKRLMIAFAALRGYIATHSIINYPQGLNPNQIKMLHLVFHHPGVSQTSAAERLGVTTASISTSVREMESQGLIERRPDPEDARVMLMYIAPYGEQIFEQVFDSFINSCASLLDKLPHEDQRELVERFEKALIASNIDLDGGKLNYADKLHIAKRSPNPVSC